MNKRSSGILLHISSLPSAYGIGDLGPQAYAMVDLLKSAGQTYWQVLPINPTDGINGHSPYSCFSAFGGNALLISPDLMHKDGFLRSKDLKSLSNVPQDSVDYAKVGILKAKIFDLAFARWMVMVDRRDFNQFCALNKDWLNDYAIFVAIKEVFKGTCFNEWPNPLRRRQPRALAKFVKEHAQMILRTKFIQYLFSKQWRAFKKYANSQNIRIIGDIPIYVNYDSVEVWGYPQFFKLDGAGLLKFVSGCPPDYFSKTGQRWGNPVYDWANLKKVKYAWWVSRIRHNLELFDELRIDHFRGFLSYWQIPAHEKLAVFGRWVKGPGEDFFKTLAKHFKSLPIIAEDLGEITPDVPALMKKFDIPGMRVLLFGFGGDSNTNPHVPANYPEHSIVYTGTHDNNTVQGWLHSEAKAHERANIAHVLGQKSTPRNLHWDMITALMKSRAKTVIIPLTDILGLRESSRMNTPATKINNWKWRVTPQLLQKIKSKKLCKLTRLTKRI